jgi:hypothetical protein
MSAVQHLAGNMHNVEARATPAGPLHQDCWFCMQRILLDQFILVMKHLNSAKMAGSWDSHFHAPDQPGYNFYVSLMWIASWMTIQFGKSSQNSLPPSIDFAALLVIQTWFISCHTTIN